MIIENELINMNDIESEPDPISRIILLKIYLKTNNIYIDIIFINKHLELIKSYIFRF